MIKQLRFKADATCPRCRGQIIYVDFHYTCKKCGQNFVVYDGELAELKRD